MHNAQMNDVLNNEILCDGLLRKHCKGKGIPITGHEGPRGMRMQGSTYSQPWH